MINAYLHIDGMKLRLLHFDFNFNQDLGTNNKPISNTKGGIINVTLESTKDVSMLEWVESNSMLKDGRIEVFNNEGTQITFKIDFANAYGTMGAYSFQSFSSEPMSYTITIIPGVIRFNGDNNNLFIQSWNPSNPFTDNTPLTVREETEFQIIDCYYTDLEGNEVAEPATGDEVYLVLHTENGVGETTDIDLANQTKDFMYNGEVLENDILKDYLINSDQDKIKLRVVAQQEGEQETLQS